MNNQSINLELFCDPGRPEIERPLSIGEWSYGTNGHILVRIPRRDDIAENKTLQFPEKLLAILAEPHRYKPAPKFEIPEKLEWENVSECYACQTTGKEHGCPGCQCKCRFCDGTGKITSTDVAKVKIGKVPFNAKYVSWLNSMPDLKIGVPRHAQPMPFRFNGGEGLLMPLSR